MPKTIAMNNSKLLFLQLIAQWFIGEDRYRIGVPSSWYYSDSLSFVFCHFSVRLNPVDFDRLLTMICSSTTFITPEVRLARSCLKWFWSLWFIICSFFVLSWQLSVILWSPCISVTTAVDYWVQNAVTKYNEICPEDPISFLRTPLRRAFNVYNDANLKYREKLNVVNMSFQSFLGKNGIWDLLGFGTCWDLGPVGIWE